MEILNLKGTEDTPTIILDKKNGIFEISGRSLPEDSAEFSRPVIDWINGYAKEANPATEFVFKLEYFNTASSKLILCFGPINEEQPVLGKISFANPGVAIWQADTKTRRPSRHGDSISPSSPYVT